MLQMQQLLEPASGRSAVSTTPSRTIVLRNAVEPPDHSSGLSPRSPLTGCPWHDVKTMLREVGLRPTRQRMALGWILFGKGDRHITAEMLYEEATKAKVPVSLATVYNTLHQFTDVGLLRQVASTAPRPISTPTFRSITTFLSKERTICLISLTAMSSSARPRSHRKAMRLRASTWSSAWRKKGR